MKILTIMLKNSVDKYFGEKRDKVERTDGCHLINDLPSSVARGGGAIAYWPVNQNAE